MTHFVNSDHAVLLASMTRHPVPVAVGVSSALVGALSAALGGLLGPLLLWFVAALVLFLYAQARTIVELSKERDELLVATPEQVVDVFALARVQGVAPPPVRSPLAYQVDALRQVLDFFRVEGRREVTVAELDTALVRLRRRGVRLPYEPLLLSECGCALETLVNEGELVPIAHLARSADRPAHVASYSLTALEPGVCHSE